MENSRKSPRRNNRDDLPQQFERALEDILARVCVLPARAASRVIALAYSGGLDSSVLLQLAQPFAAARGIALHLLHIHHGLSPHADAWERHCRQQAAQLGLPFQSARVQVARNDGGGIEQAARIERYRQLGILCRQLGAPLLLTAHHLDDQAETVLLQMMRGAGLPGLSGMPMLQPDSALLGGAVALARPLLAVPRAALEQRARQLGLTHVDDESNADLRYRRNGVRHRVFPLLQAEFPGFATRLTRVASHMQSAQRLLDEVAQSDLLACASSAAGETLELAALAQLSTDRLGNLLRYWLYRQGVSLPSATRLEEIRWQLFEAGADMHPCFDFGPVQLRRVRQRLELQPTPAALPLGELLLRWQGQAALEVPQWGGRLLFAATTGPGLAPERLRAGLLTLRPRSGSERLKPAMNRPSKNLKQLFQERAIPPWQRLRLPLVYLDGQLILAGGLGMDARMAAASPGIVLAWQADSVAGCPPEWLERSVP